MQFSVWPNFTRTWSELTGLARHAEAQGWYGLWYPDHYMGDHADGEPTDEPALECWATVAGLAAVTSTLRLGTLVSPTTMHHPALLAKRAAAVDQISGGRLTLGIGAGWQANEHRAYGIDLLGAKERVDRFDEAIQILHGMLTQPRTTVRGRHFEVIDAPCEPKPVQSPLPLLVGTTSPRMARLAARFATDWNMWGTPDHVASIVPVIEAACEIVGRDPATLRRSCQAMIYIADSEEAAASYRQRARPDRSLIGTTAQIADQVQRYRDLGIAEFIVPDFNLGRTHEDRLAKLDRFWSDIAGVV